MIRATIAVVSFFGLTDGCGRQDAEEATPSTVAEARTEEADGVPVEADGVPVEANDKPAAVATLSAGSVAAIEAGSVADKVRDRADDDGLILSETHEGVLDANSGVLSDDSSLFDRYKVQVPAGATIELTMTSAEFDTYLILKLPDGTSPEGTQNDDCGDSTLRTERATDSCLRYSATEGGLYEVLANTYEAGEAGAYTLTMKVLATRGTTPTLAPAEASAPAQSGEAQTYRGALGPGDPLHSADESFYDLYTVVLEAGGSLDVTMSADGGSFDTYLQLFGPGDMNEALIENDDCAHALYKLPNAYDSCIHQFSAPVSGRYTVLANSYEAGMTGAYTLWVAPR